MVHFKNRVIPGVIALLNGSVSRNSETTETPFSTVFSPHGVSVLSERSLVSQFGTLTGRGVPGYPAGRDTVALVGVPGGGVMGNGWW